MLTARTRTTLTRLTLTVGAIALLVTGADHLYEYAANHFSTVPTIGTLFLLNFIGSALVAVGLLMPWRRMTARYALPLRGLLALSGITIAATSLIGLWISESSSLFGFTDYGFRTTIVVAIVAEATSVVALTGYLALAHPLTAFRVGRLPIR